MLLLTASIWLLLGMAYLDRFVSPFDALQRWLMPWQDTSGHTDAASAEGLIGILQAQLHGSQRVAHYSFVVMVATFTLLCVYLTLVYQQKQRRSRENELLAIKNEEIARRNEFIRYISATIGHEFKNNLGRIKRRIDLLRTIPEDAKARIDDNMEKLFADIDIFKKISDEREAGLIRFEKIDLGEMLADLARQYDDLADIRLEGKTSVPAIFASQTLVTTVFENLIDNAIKYKKPDQARARVHCSFSEDMDRDRRYVTMSFRDEGIGMDEQEADNCFYKRKSSEGGWGEGLYFVKYAIGLHAGKIKAGKEYTERGTGTEIIINLPLVKESL